MLGPIPNSLGAGALNGSFFPHGLVTFQRRVLVRIRQEVCIGGEVVTEILLEAVMTAEKALDAGFIDQILLDGEVVTYSTLEGVTVTVTALDGLVEEC